MSDMKNQRRTSVMNIKKTEVMNESEWKRTAVMYDSGIKKTEVLYEESPACERITDYTSQVLNGKYRLLRLLTDDSGEADIYISEYNNENYIVKLYRRNFKYDEQKLKIIWSINSKYVIKILDHGIYNERFFEVMPYYKNGDFSDVRITEEFALNVMIPNMISGLNEIHKTGVIHKDIKPSNIFLSDDKSHIVISDFGISSVIGDKVTHKHTGNAKTAIYSAIETFDDNFARESDYYSLGITLMEMLTGRTSYEGCSEREIFKRKFLNKLTIPSTLSERFISLIKGLTIMGKDDRWKYEEVDRWLSGENVEIKESVNAVLMQKPYAFNGKSITDRKELASELATNWDSGIKHFMRGYLTDHFKDFDQDTASNIHDCFDRAKGDKKQYEFFKVIHFIDPGSSLIWMGEDLGNVNEIIKKLKTKPYNKNSSLVKFLFSGCIEHYLRLNNVSENLIGAIEEITKMSKMYPEKAYYMFILLDNSDFYFRDRTFTEIEELIYYFEENINDADSMARELENSEYFNAWINKIGFGHIYNKYFN